MAEVKVWWLEREHERKIIAEKVDLDLNQTPSEIRVSSVTKKVTM